LAAAGVARDSDDDKFRAFAVTEPADSIIRRYNDLLKRITDEGIPILTPAAFLRRRHDLQN